jgi:hypothetical protein
MVSSEKNVLERVPRADRLDLLRDILHLLAEFEGVSGKRRLLYETRQSMGKTEACLLDAATFEDYLAAGQVMTLLEETGDAVSITEKGTSLVKMGLFGYPNLVQIEQVFFKNLILEYQPFRTFINVGFRKGFDFSNYQQILIDDECPKRTELLRNYMKVKNHSTDREARTLLGWSQQIGLVEFDEYSQQYYLIRESPIDLDLFLKELYQIYLQIRDPVKKLSLIPELRATFCCSANISRKVFDETLLKLNELMPSKVQLGKASSSRDVVRKFGVHGKTFYYYYIKVV